MIYIQGFFKCDYEGCLIEQQTISQTKWDFLCQMPTAKIPEGWQVVLTTDRFNTFSIYCPEHKAFYIPKD